LFLCFKGVPDGKIVGFALRKQLFHHRKVNYAVFYEIFETLAFGKVTGTCRIRNLRPHDAWSFVMKKGNIQRLML
jgi:phage head maturation protease